MRTLDLLNDLGCVDAARERHDASFQKGHTVKVKRFGNSRIIVDAGACDA